MKINKVKIVNINSLKGEYNIDFEQEPLSKASLFAITGPTGSGKSTILDAITLALYKKVPRTGEVNKNTILEGHILNKNSKSCSATVEFEAGGTRYQSEWFINHNRNNKLNDYEMEVRNIDKNEIINEKKSEVVNINIELSGLTYDQFLKSIMLSQGEFDRFLKADDKEKTHLLEKITGGDIYKIIGSKVFQRNKTEENKLNELVAKKEYYSVWTEEEEKAWQEKLDQITQYKKSLYQQKENKNNALNKKQEIQNLLSRIESEKKELEQWKKKYQEHEKDFQLLSNHLELKEYNTQFYALEEARKTVEQKTEQYSELKNKIKQNKDQLINEKQSYEQISKELKSIKEEKEQVESIIPKVREIDQQIFNKKEHTNRLEKELNDIDKKINELESAIAQKNKEIKDLESEKNELDSWVKAKENIESYFQYDKYELKLKLENYQKEKKEINNYIEKLSFSIPKGAYHSEENFYNFIKNKSEEVDSNIQSYVKAHTVFYDNKELPDQLTDKIYNIRSLADQLSHLLHNNQSYLNNIKEHEENKSAYNKQCEEKNNEIEKLTKEYEEKENYLKDLDQKLKLEEKYHEDRVNLQEGDPCPLCGATHHPYAVNTENDHIFGDIENKKKEYKEQNELFKQLKDNLENLKQKKGNIEVKIQSKEELINTYQQYIDKNLQELTRQIHDINKLKDDFLQVINKEGLNEFFTLTQSLDNNMKEEDLKNFKEELKRTDNALKKYRNETYQYQTIKSDYALLEDMLKRFETLRKEKSYLTQVLKKYHYLIDSSKTYQEQINQLDNIAEQWEKNKEKLKDIDQKIELNKQNYNSYKEDTGNKKEERQNKAIEYDTYKKDLENLKKERSELFGDKNVDEEQKSIQEKYEDNNNKYHEVEKNISNLKTNIDSFNQQLEQLSKELNSKEEHLKRQENELLNALKNLGYESITAAKQQMLSNDRENALHEEKTRLDNAIQDVNSRLKDHRVQYEEKKDIEPEKELEEIKKELKELESKHEEYVQQETSIKQSLEQNKKHKNELQNLQLSIEEQDKITRKWKQLNHLIGDATGQRFSKIAQSITLTLLVEFANNKIEYFTDRYKLRKKDDERIDKPEMDMVIIDVYMANQERAINTLSGGETFLISLSMALALADLAGSKTQIENLFIDEGFGSLDEESLDQALNALEILQIETNRKIGVISHVKALQERIPTHIRVVKEANGNSRLITDDEYR